MSVINKTIPNENRNYQADNIRFILIVLTVFGHVLETFSGPVNTIIYRIIYTFHMPAFLFLSGCFAKFSPIKILKRLVFPYFVFQLVYLYVTSIISGQGVVTQFTTPVWLLWYLLALIVYYCSIPFFDVSNRRIMLIVVCVGSMCALLVGFDSTVGYFLSFSRIVVFFPFFISGFYCRKIGLSTIQSICQKRKKECIVILTALIILLELFIAKSNVPVTAFYGSYCYSEKGSDEFTRILFLLCAFIWILFLFLTVPNIKIPVVTKMGSNTMSVFLLHGIIKMLIEKHALLHYSEAINLLLSVVIVAAIMALLNTRYITALFRKL